MHGIHPIKSGMQHPLGRVNLKASSQQYVFSLWGKKWEQKLLIETFKNSFKIIKKKTRIFILLFESQFIAQSICSDID